MSAAHQVLCCPRCEGGLFPAEAEALLCEKCSQRYPSFSHIPCLVKDPAFWCALWLSRLEDYRQLVEMRVVMLQAELERDDVLPLTQRRIDRFADGLKVQLAAFENQFKPLQAGAHAPPKGVIPAQSAPGELTVAKCYENLFRDWVWGDSEAAQVLSLVEQLAPPSLGKLAVYGAGAGRLAVDIHVKLKPELTVAHDLNPFPLLVASRLIRGENVTLPEFPVAPNSEKLAVVNQTLSCVQSVDEHFQFVFADALNAPFGAGSLDTIVTSWVIDALDADFRDTALALNTVLRPGGMWLNVGPLRFDGPLSQAYCIEEVHEIVEQCGFSLLKRRTETVDYFNSAFTGAHRRDTVFCFTARKDSDAERRTTRGVHPLWLMDTSLPIPLTAQVQALLKSSVFTIGVLNLVDGRRSLSDIAAVLGAQWHLPAETLQGPLRAYLAKLGLN